MPLYLAMRRETGEVEKSKFMLAIGLAEMHVVLRMPPRIRQNAHSSKIFCLLSHPSFKTSPKQIHQTPLLGRPAPHDPIDPVPRINSHELRLHRAPPLSPPRATRALDPAKLMNAPPAHALEQRKHLRPPTPLRPHGTADALKMPVHDAGRHAGEAEEDVAGGVVVDIVVVAATAGARGGVGGRSKV